MNHITLEEHNHSMEYITWLDLTPDDLILEILKYLDEQDTYSLIFITSDRIAKRYLIENLKEEYLFYKRTPVDVKPFVLAYLQFIVRCKHENILIYELYNTQSDDFRLKKNLYNFTNGNHISRTIQDINDKYPVDIIELISRIILLSEGWNWNWNYDEIEFPREYEINNSLFDLIKELYHNPYYTYLINIKKLYIGIIYSNDLWKNGKLGLPFKEEIYNFSFYIEDGSNGYVIPKIEYFEYVPDIIIFWNYLRYIRIHRNRINEIENKFDQKMLDMLNDMM